MIVVVAAVVLACAAGYFYFQNRTGYAMMRSSSCRPSVTARRQRAADLEQKIEELETRLSDDAVPAPAAETLREAFAPDNATQELPEALKAESVQDRVMNFFALS